VAATDEARSTLLRVLDVLGDAEAELEGAVERVDVVVAYSIGRRDVDDGGAWHEVAGWASTAGPKWAHAALLRRAADAYDVAERAVDDEVDDDDG
jgi:hypothetical protein